MRALVLVASCLMPFAGCSCSSSMPNHGPGGSIDGLVSIAVMPADQTLVISGTTAATSR